MRFLFSLAFLSVAFAASTLTNADVVRMVQQGIAPATITASIQSAETTDFQVTPEDQPALREAGVSKDLIDAMMRRRMKDSARSNVADATGKSRAPEPASRQSKPELPDTKANDTLTITSLQDGATVEWNRKVIGKTPLTRHVGEYAFNSRKSSVFSKRLSQPVVLRISKTGYVPREITITKEMVWQSLNGANRFVFFVITANAFQVDLDRVSAEHKSLTNLDIIKLRQAEFGDDLIIDRINSSPAAFHLELADLVELRKAGVSDPVIQAMLHAK